MPSNLFAWGCKCGSRFVGSYGSAQEELRIHKAAGCRSYSPDLEERRRMEREELEAKERMMGRYLADRMDAEDANV